MKSWLSEAFSKRRRFRGALDPICIELDGVPIQMLVTHIDGVTIVPDSIWQDPDHKEIVWIKVPLGGQGYLYWEEGNG